MKTQTIIDTLRMAYQYLGKAIADSELKNCAMPLESAFEKIGLVIHELEQESGIPKPPLTGAELIIHERERQMSVEGWDAQHDDEHTEGELAIAASLYATPIPLFAERKTKRTIEYYDPWPWHDTMNYDRYDDGGVNIEVPAWDKRKKHNKLRRLVIAGALIAAEIDRLQRLGNRLGNKAKK